MPTGPGEAARLTDDPGEEYAPQWSLDGRSLCYGQQNADSRNGTRLLQRNGDNWGPPILLHWSEAEISTGLPGCIGWLPDGRHLLVPTKGGVTQIQVDGREPRMIYAADPSRGRPIPGATILSPDGNTIYFRTAEGFWGLPATGGTPRLLVRFDDPARQSTRPEWGHGRQPILFQPGRSAERCLRRRSFGNALMAVSRLPTAHHNDHPFRYTGRSHSSGIEGLVMVPFSGSTVSGWPWRTATQPSSTISVSGPA